MSLPLNFPHPSYTMKLTLDSSFALDALCVLAGIACKGSGAWRQRPIEPVPAAQPFIEAAPGGWGPVRVGVPPRYAKTQRSVARYVLGAMAYGLFDPIARESIKGQPWTKIENLGRPRSGKALSAARRQQRYRQNQQMSG
jgi:hypothetical protein